MTPLLYQYVTGKNSMLWTLIATKEYKLSSNDTNFKSIGTIWIILNIMNSCNISKSF